MGLAGTMSPDQLAALSSHPSQSVRRGAVVALRRLAAPEVRAFLDDSDELVLLEAARAIHDDASITAALPDLARILEQEGLTSEGLIRRAINAALRHGPGADLEHLVSYLERREGSPKLRRTALAAILWWSEPPVLDAVEGRFRQHAPRDRSAAKAAVARLLPIIETDNELQEVLLNGVAVRRQPEWLKVDLNSFASKSIAVQTRILTALSSTGSARLRAFVELALTSRHQEVREKAREQAQQAGIPQLETLLAIINDPSPAGQGRAVLQLARLEDPRARQQIALLADRFRDGKAAADWKLELWQAAGAIGIDLPETPDRLEHGGDPKRGRKLVMEHAAARGPSAATRSAAPAATLDQTLRRSAGHWIAPNWLPQC